MESPESSDFEKEKIRRLRRAMYSRSLSGQLKKRPRRELPLEKETAPSDWRPPEAEVSQTTTAPRGIGATRSILNWLLGGAILFFVISVAVFIYFFTFGAGGSAAAPGNIDIEVQGPISITGGEPVELQIAVTNRNQTALELTDLIVEYPPGTRSSTDFLTDLPRTRISLGAIEPGGRRQGTVQAVFVGQENERATVRVEVEYRVANSNAIFVAEKNYQVAFTAAPIAVSIEANNETISGQDIILTTVVRSNTDSVVRDVLVEADYPFGFTPRTIAPEATYEDNVWEIGDLRPGGEYTITIRGTVEGQTNDERVFRFNAGTRADRTHELLDFSLAEGLHRVVVARPFLGLDISLNRSSGDSSTVLQPGETVNVAISWQNNLSTTITDAVLVANLSGLAVPGTSILTTDGFYRSSDRTVLWDKTTTGGEFARVEPGQRGVVGFSFQVPQEDALLDVRESALDIVVNAAGRRLGQEGVPETMQASAHESLKLISNLQFVGQAFYYSNPFGSVGPLPPKVNEETTYAVVFTVANTSNTIEDAVLTAVLPPYARWLGAYSPASERLTFVNSAGTVEWDLGDIEAGVGVEGTPSRQVAFSIGITPSESQIGQDPALIRDMRLSGVDTFTKTSITRTQEEVTTNLIDDPGFSTEESTVAPAN